jgi:hypothetical protein
MTENDAVSEIVAGLYGPASIVTKLRDGTGLDKSQLARTKQAIMFLTEEYRERQCVPKRVALSFIDIRNLMLSGFSLYSETEQDEIEDAVEDLVDLAYKLFGANTET